ncbi:HipA family kinase [Leptospira wolffii]|uniref:HipA family kinase n=1 Tax=Leptospira wolffii TaxID=409998 RepID=A0ABV5BSG1_9LEPT|nr:HipA family kinase [Leptospira wolffii]TGL51923.1 hypothetical protein EHQ61_08165 [Leptospira wolffii]
METYSVQKILSSKKIGSSWPLLVETPIGKYILKLSGTGQGQGVLVSEVIAGDLADRLDLPTPRRILLELGPDLISEDEDPELVRLLRNSIGINLGFEYIPYAKSILEDPEFLMDDWEASKVLWFDWLIENPDRTRTNPNIIVRERNYWLIDHGAAFPFQYNLSGLTEYAPTRPWLRAKDHLFYDYVNRLREVHILNAEKLTFADLEIVTWGVPDEFLQGKGYRLSYDEISRKKEMFAAYLWKRIKGFVISGF